MSVLIPLLSATLVALCATGVRIWAPSVRRNAMSPRASRRPPYGLVLVPVFDVSKTEGPPFRSRLPSLR